MNFDKLFHEVEKKIHLIDSKINEAKIIEIQFRKLQDDVFNLTSNEFTFISSINRSRYDLISKVKAKLECDLNLVQNGVKILPWILKTDHENIFSLFEFISLSYKNDISILKKIKYTEYFNFTKIIELSSNFQNKNYITCYPISNFSFFISNSILNEINLIMANGSLIKRLKLQKDNYCKFHVYESKIFMASCNLNFENTLVKVFDLKFNLLKQKDIVPGFIYFFNSNFVNFCMNEQNEHQIFDSDLNKVLTLKDIYRNPIIDIANNRIIFLEDYTDGLYLKINSLKDDKLIEKIKINSLSSFSFIIDEQSNIYIRMMDSADSLFYIYCFDLNGNFLFKKYLPNLESFHSLRLISFNQIALIDSNRNSFAII